MRNRRAIIARLLIGVLKGLGGASQEDQQPALVLGSDFTQKALAHCPEPLQVSAQR